MTVLPMADRELRIKSRQSGTYVGRWLAVAAALAISSPMLFSGSRGRPDGASMFTALSILAMMLCLLEGARQTADCLSSERREGTLGLLFLTDLKGYDIILGKLAATSLSSLYGLVAILPVLGLSLLAGGVTGGQFWRMTLVLVSALFFSLAIGMWVSARSRDEQKVVAGASLLLVAIAGGMPLIDFLLLSPLGLAQSLALFSPGYACYLAFDMPYRAAPAAFWWSLAAIHASSWGFLWLAARRITDYRQEEETPREGVWQNLAPEPTHDTAADRAAWIASVRRNTARRHRLLQVNPVLWLNSKISMKPTWLWVLAVSMVFHTLTTLIPGVARPSFSSPIIFNFVPLFGTLLHFLFWYCVASIASSFFVRARRIGSLELLLSTPLRDQDILRGIWLHLKRTLAGPLFCLWGAEVLNVLLLRLTYSGIFFSGFLLAYFGFSAARLFTQAVAICWVGLFLSLSANKPGQAAFRTFLYVVLLPWLLCSGMLWGRFLFPMRVLGGSGFPIFTILISLFWMLWARRRMQPGVRALVRPHLFGETKPSPLSPSSSDLSFALLKSP